MGNFMEAACCSKQDQTINEPTFGNEYDKCKSTIDLLTSVEY